MRLTAIRAAAVLVLAAAALCGYLLVATYGIGAYRITTDSMAPDLARGTVVVTARSLHLVVGKPVTFVADGNVVTHVLVGYAEDGALRTRGIANPADDRWRMPVHPADVRGGVLFGIALFAPSFWTGLRGIAAAGAGCVLAAMAAWRLLVRSRLPMAT